MLVFKTQTWNTGTMVLIFKNKISKSFLSYDNIILQNSIFRIRFEWVLFDIYLKDKVWIFFIFHKGGEPNFYSNQSFTYLTFIYHVN